MNRILAAFLLELTDSFSTFELVKVYLKQFRFWMHQLLRTYSTWRRNRVKLFVIGFNKTGTTSVYAALQEFDIIVGNQRKAELLVNSCIAKDYKPVLDYCKTAEAFQDIPFSKPGIFKILDKHYPNSKYILTIRDTPEQWFQSMSKFHAKKFGQNGLPPTEADMKDSNYVYKAWLYESHTWTYGTDLYNAAHYKEIYEQHLSDVKDHFKDRKQDLLILNVADTTSYKKLCEFIGETPLRDTFEWKNKTEALKK